MRVTKSQIVHGIIDYVQTDILPKMGNGRALQILVSVCANAVAANSKIVDAIFGNQIIRSALDDDGSGTFEIDGIVAALIKAIREYGSFPLKVPPIPLISPSEMTLNLSADDVEAMQSRIEDAV